MSSQYTVDDFSNAVVVYARPLTNMEKHMQNKGFPFVHTITLKPYGKLKCHGHNSHNSHFVIRGRLSVTKKGDSRVRSVGAWKKLHVMRGQMYEGISGPNGCRFVEGHTVLSPTTALRFAEAGTLRLATKDDKEETLMKVSGADAVAGGPCELAQPASVFPSVGRE